MPDECFQKNMLSAWGALMLTLFFLLLGYVGLMFLPWYCMPFCWFFLGLAFVGLFAIGHDCGHYLFAQKSWVNHWVGHLVMMPIIYPFYNWQIHHNAHHRFTNKLGGPRWKQLNDVLTRKVDVVWYPLRKDTWQLLSKKEKFIYRLSRKNLWWLTSILNWWYEVNLRKDKLSRREWQKVRFSVALVSVFAACACVGLILGIGVLGLVQFWFMPWLMFHIWLSLFSRIQHSSPDIPWKTAQDWNNAEAQLCGTVTCHFPRWVELICHDFNIHIPHHVSTAIPHYHLRKAQAILEERWGEYIKQSYFSWELFQQMSRLNLYDPAADRHLSFAELDAS
ncbi:MAG: fatty acid desaturase [Cyanobacteria bacterium P01_C01_bin.69]